MSSIFSNASELVMHLGRSASVLLTDVYGQRRPVIFGLCRLGMAFSSALRRLVGTR